MPLDARHAAILRRADRALNGVSPVDAVAKVKAIIGPRSIPSSEVAAQSALNKLRQGDPQALPTAEELTALEIVVRLLRPVVYCRHQQLDDLPSKDGTSLLDEEIVDQWSSFRTRISTCLGSIGRIDDRRGQHVGTGFILGEGLVATNHHVLSVLTSGADALAPGSARIVFGYELDIPDEADAVCAIDGVAAVHPTLDLVLLRARTGTRQPLRLASQPPRAGERVVTIGYPGRDEVNNPVFLTSVFGTRFGVKRASQGEVLEEPRESSLFHDCSTTRGNSGSPVLSLADGAVCGVHRSGYFMYRNEAVASVEADALMRTVA